MEINTITILIDNSCVLLFVVVVVVVVRIVVVVVEVLQKESAIVALSGVGDENERIDDIGGPAHAGRIDPTAGRRLRHGPRQRDRIETQLQRQEERRRASLHIDVLPPSLHTAATRSTQRYDTPAAAALVPRAAAR
jgi:hypothetical protein